VGSRRDPGPGSRWRAVGFTSAMACNLPRERQQLSQPGARPLGDAQRLSPLAIARIARDHTRETAARGDLRRSVFRWTSWELDQPAELV
jgi:hypothetical protein